MSTSASKARRAFNLIEKVTSQESFKAFLKTRGFSFSAGSWDDLYTKRVEPLLADGRLSVRDLLHFLREVEECGHKHIFLFSCPPARAKAMMATGRIQSIAAELGLSRVLVEPLALDMPSQPSIADIRQQRLVNDTGVVDTLTVKVVETRQVHRQATVEVDEATGDLLKRYVPENQRAVNVVRLHSDGLLEVRVASHTSSSKYQAEVARVRQVVGRFMPRGEFVDVPLTRAKNKLANEAPSLRNMVRFSETAYKNDHGNLLRANTSSLDDDLTSDTSVQESLSSFAKGNAYCVSTNIYFKMPKGSDEEESQKEVHVLMSGDANEFAITATCRQEEYEYVLKQIRTLNQ